MSSLKPTDHLALKRTQLANERTFLAYFRTFLVFLSSGFAVLKLPALAEIRVLGIVLMAIAPLFLIIGLYRLYRVKQYLRHFLETEE